MHLAHQFRIRKAQQISTDDISAYKVKGCGEIFCHQIDRSLELDGSFNQLFDHMDVVSSASTGCKASLCWTCNVEHVSLQPPIHTAYIYLMNCAETSRLMPLYPVGPEGSLYGFSMEMMMDRPQSIGKIQSLAITEYLYTSASMSSHPQA